MGSKEIRDVDIEDSATQLRKAHLPWLFVKPAEVFLQHFLGGEYFINCVVDQHDLEQDGLHLVVAESVPSVVSPEQDDDAKSVGAFVTFICLHGDTGVQICACWKTSIASAVRQLGVSKLNSLILTSAFSKPGLKTKLININEVCVKTQLIINNEFGLQT